MCLPPIPRVAMSSQPGSHKMATFTVRQGQRYRAILSLGFLERLASNDMIGKKLSDAGFAEVSVSGSGASRVAEALWPGPDTTATMPSQIINVIDI